METTSDALERPDEPEPVVPAHLTDAAVVRGGVRRTDWVLAGVGATLATVLFLVVLASRWYVYDPLAALEPAPAGEDASAERIAAMGKEMKDLQSKTKRAQRNLAALAPGSIYIVVD
ncbi:MAG: hypothetical protein ACRD21_29400, partial [Vicinamibacteria bacterium]